MLLQKFINKEWYACFYLISLLIVEPFSHWMFPLQEFRIIYLYGIIGLYLWIPFLWKKKISLSRFDALLGFICLYNIQSIYQHNLLPEILLFINLYLASKLLSNNPKTLRLLCCTFCIVGCMQAMAALSQYFSWIESDNLLFRLTGTFDNSGPLGGYMAICVTISISSLQHFHINKYRKGLLISAIILQTTVLLMSDSRAAWLSTLVALLYLITGYLKWNRVKRIALYSISIILFLTISLFVYKPTSAKGRIMIWKVCAEIIKENPLLGKGFATFPEQYMHYQARYIANHPEEDTSYFTSNNCYAFNEFIHVACEQGVIGMVLLCIGLGILLRIAARSKRPKPLFSGFLVFLLFACFSYPCNVQSISLLLPIFIGTIAGFTPNKTFSIPTCLIWGIWLFSHIALCIGFAYRYQIEKKLSNYFYEENETSLSYVENRYSAIKMSGEFTFKYAKHLFLKTEYEKCIPILQQAILLYPSTDKYLDLGECYQQTGNIKQAELCYEYASQMLPRLIYPPYHLFNLYRQNENTKKALETAIHLIKINPISKTDFVRDIQLEAKQYIKSNQ